ncbi:MAG: 1-(5-phosphoribosyl)-5-[(5-phosphoribosylamino)methylideneamino]imidazole-4-carboxamide isomerase [Dehalococcoidia bacterium]
MEIIPAVDIRGGRCVRLYQGDYQRETVFADDPLAVARSWQDAGATRLHVVDLDGARQGRPVNAQVVGRIIRALSIPVQVGGGLRDHQSIEAYLEMGADRVILGTAAVKDRSLLAEAIAAHGPRIVVAVDARLGTVAIEGWREDTALAAAELMTELAAVGVPRFIYTAALRDGTLEGPDFAGLEAMLARINVPVIYAGGISSIADLLRLASLRLEGAIVGQALYTRAVNFQEALRALGQTARPERGFPT